MQNPNPPRNSSNECWTVRLRLACIFVVVLSIGVSNYHPEFPRYILVPLQYYAQDFDVLAEDFYIPEDFKIAYMKMERTFKIFVYPHNTTLCDEPRKLEGEYANEGLFLENIYQSRFLTKDPDEAHLFLIPISCHSLPAEGRSVDERTLAVEDFVKSLISKYPYWNRTSGADHFFVTCSDIQVTATARIVDLGWNTIRVMCAPSDDVEYVPHKDISLPQTVQPFNVSAAGNDTLERTILAFWSGQADSYIRELLVKLWSFDQELDIHIGLQASTAQGRLQSHYGLSMSKFCICPGGPQLDGVIAVAINYGCVPVILSSYYDLPLNQILDWKKFSIILDWNDIYELKKILKDIPKQEYEALHNNTTVQKHFQWNLPAVRLDAFHMVMYELWTRRYLIKYNKQEP